MNIKSQTSTYPLITIGIPVYNTPKDDIERCFLSVFEQTYKDIEVLVINDCCTDDTIENIKIIAKEHHCDNKLRIVYHDHNQGVSGSRNTILREAHGVYLFFMDCDDYIEKNTIEILQNEANTKNADTVWGSIKIKHFNTTEEIEYKKFPYLVLDGQTDIAKHSKTFGIHWFPVIWNILIKTDLLRNNNMRFQSVGTYDDYLFQFQLLPLINKAVLIPDSTYCWIVRQGSQSFITGRTFNTTHTHNAIKAELFIKDYYNSRPNKDLHGYYYPLICTHAFYQACYIVKHRKHFEEPIQLSKIKKMLSPMMSITDISKIKHNRINIYFFYFLSKCPSSILPTILRIISKIKWT